MFRAAVLAAPGEPLSIRPVEFDDLASGDVFVRIAGVGICHTDLAALDGTIRVPLPIVLGHEGAGVVEAIAADVEALAVGDHVVLSFDSCRRCVTCGRGHPAYCEQFAALNYGGRTCMRVDARRLHGGWLGQSSFGSHAIASVRNAVRVDRDLPLDILGPLGCGLLTGAGAVLEVMEPEPGQGIAVFGLGAVGLGAVMAAAAVGCRPIIGIDPNADRVALARELGATNGAAPSDFDQRRAGLDFALDAVGTGEVIRQALGALRSPGTCVTVGLRGGANDITISQGHLLWGRTLRGVIEGDTDPHRFIPMLTELWRRGQFPFERLVRRFPLPEINDAVAAMRRGDVVKAVLVNPA